MRVMLEYHITCIRGVLMRVFTDNIYNLISSGTRNTRYLLPSTNYKHDHRLEADIEFDLLVQLTFFERIGDFSMHNTYLDKL